MYKPLAALSFLKSLLVLALLALTLPVKGQALLYEFKLSQEDADGEPDYLVMEPHGVILLWGPSSARKSWRARCLDSNLVQTWQADLPIGAEYDLHLSGEDPNGTGVWLYMQNAQQRNKTLILHLGYQRTQPPESFARFIPIDYEPEHLQAANNGVYVWGLIDLRPVMIYLPASEEGAVVLPFISQKEQVVAGTMLQSGGDDFWVATTQKKRFRKKTLARQYREGRFTGIVRSITLPAGHAPSRVFFQEDKNGNLGYTGTWTYHDVDMPQGFFRRFTGDSSIAAFTDSSGFYHHLPAGRARRLKKRLTSKRKPYLYHRFMVHDPWELNDGRRVVLLERYYQRQHSPYPGPPFLYSQLNNGYLPASKEYKKDYVLVAITDSIGHVQRLETFDCPEVTDFELKYQVFTPDGVMAYTYLRGAMQWKPIFDHSAPWKDVPAGRLSLPEKDYITIQGMGRERQRIYFWGQRRSAVDGAGYYFLGSLM